MDGEVLHSVEFLRKRHWTLRVDLWLVTIVYGVLLISIGPCLDALIVLCRLVALQILISLFALDLKGVLQYSKVNDIHHADACKVIPDKFSGSKGVVLLQKVGDHLEKAALKGIDWDYKSDEMSMSKVHQKLFDKDWFICLHSMSRPTRNMHVKDFEFWHWPTSLFQ